MNEVFRQDMDAAILLIRKDDPPFVRTFGKGHNANCISKEDFTRRFIKSCLPRQVSEKHIKNIIRQLQEDHYIGYDTGKGECIVALNKLTYFDPISGYVVERKLAMKARRPRADTAGKASPHAGEIPTLNLLLGGFAAWGVGKCATVQDIVVQYSINVDITEAQLLSTQLLEDNLIEIAYKRGQEYEYVQPGKSGLQIGYERIPGFALTRAGRQFHLDGGYKVSSPVDPVLPLVKETVKPKTKPAKTNKKPLSRFAKWREDNPGTVVLLGFALAIALVVLGVWLTVNWDGHFTRRSMNKLFDIDTVAAPAKEPIPAIPNTLLDTAKRKP